MSRKTIQFLVVISSLFSSITLQAGISLEEYEQFGAMQDPTTVYKHLRRSWMLIEIESIHCKDATNASPVRGKVLVLEHLFGIEMPKKFELTFRQIGFDAHGDGSGPRPGVYEKWKNQKMPCPGKPGDRLIVPVETSETQKGMQRMSDLYLIKPESDLSEVKKLILKVYKEKEN